MRLIDVKSLALITFLEDQTPEYAILSHTWGAAEEEVTFQQMSSLSESPDQNDTATWRVKLLSKNGFVKIREAAILAQKDGLQYLWVDTCCIDKTSSAELSEAINSMYRWYQASAVCYAYLSDVGPELFDEDSDGQPVSSSELLTRWDMQGYTSYSGPGRWFKRGWTLQELIAPRIVRFYAKDWSLIGEKSPKSLFWPILLRESMVDESVLNGHSQVKEVTVASRMRWASKRKTSRPEDMAYCLLGLFDVNMPLLYGEGGPQAFLRLQEEIIKGSSRSLVV